MNSLLQDVRFALRTFARNPWFSAIAIATLALGIGANTAIFSVASAVALRPLPLPDAGRLVAVNFDIPRDKRTRMPVPIEDMFDWRSESRSFEGLAASRTVPMNLNDGGLPQPVVAARVSANMLSLLGLSPALGRDFLQEEDKPGRGNVALISHALWQERYSAARDVLGKTLSMDGTAYTVVGVLPQAVPENPAVPSSAQADVWIPLVPAPNELNRAVAMFRVTGKLRPGVTPDEAAQELNLFNARIEQANPRTVHQGWTVAVIPARDYIAGDLRPVMLVLLGAVGFVLLIACANVANLLLARAVGRTREFAVRTALGAQPRRLVRQLLIESLCLSALATIAALLVVQAALPAARSAIAAMLPRASEIRVDAAALLFAIVLALITGALFGSAPALQVVRGGLFRRLNEAGRNTAGGFAARALRSLVVAEVAVALVLFVAAGLMVRSFDRLNRVSPGFEPEGVLAAQVTLPAAKYGRPEQQAELYRQIVERVRALPGVTSAAVGFRVPLLGAGASTTYNTDANLMPPGDWPMAEARMATPGYFSTLGIPLLQGRDFAHTDRRDAPAVMVVNRTFAEKYWPGQSALGRKVRFFPEQDKWREVVGVVADVRLLQLGEEPAPSFYIPYSQSPFPNGRVSFLFVRTDTAPAALYATLREQISSLDENQAVAPVRLLSDIVSESLATRRLNTLLMVAFALLAGGLAVVGVYGVLSFFVSLRTRDIGTRLALGAQPGHILRLIAGEGLVLALIGAAIGLAAAFGLSRLLARVLYQTPATDPATYIAASVMLVVVAVVASIVPAHRASRLDPMVVLRQD